jgi:arylformamidase
MIKGPIIELSHKMVPGKENFKLEVNTDDVTKFFPEIKHSKNIWYVIGEVSMSTHVGTHIEFPLHHKKGGLDAYDYPLERLLGEAVILNFSHKSNGEAININELKNASERIKKGDMIFFRTDCDKNFCNEHWRETPYLEKDAAQWLISEFNPKVIGSDSWDIEDPNYDNQPVHTYLFQNDIAMVESATNLALVGDERVNMVILPLPIKNLDACPVRIITYPL